VADRRTALREQVVRAHQELESALDTFQEGDWSKLSPNEGWTAKDTLAHLCSIEARQRSQVQVILKGGDYPMEPIDEYNAREVAERQHLSVEQLRAELAQEHAATVALLDQVQEADLDRFYDHPTRGHVTIEGIYQTINRHTHTHTEDIAATRTTS
jgi:uncharacterized protein (TIGR03083 family)